MAKKNKIEKSDESNGTSMVTAETSATSLPQVIEGVSAQTFEDACKVIIGDELHTLKQARGSVLQGLSDLRAKHQGILSKLEKAWEEALEKDVGALLDKHYGKKSIMISEHTFFFGPFGGPRSLGDLHKVLLRVLHYPYDIGSGTAKDKIAPLLLDDYTPQELRPCLAERLELLTQLEKLDHRIDALQDRLKAMDLEVARYRIDNEDKLTEGQLDKIKAMALR